MGKVFNAAGGSIGHYEVAPSSDIVDVKIILKEGYTNNYFLDEFFDTASVRVHIVYKDGREVEDYQNYVYTPKGKLTPNDKEIIFRIVDGSNVIERHFDIQVTDYRLVPVPNPGKNLVYDGNIQFPNWNIEGQPIKIVADDTVNGSSGKSLAGTYQCKFTLTNPDLYRWDVPLDGTNNYKEDKIVSWTIDKKPEKIRIIPYNSEKEYTDNYTYTLRYKDEGIIFQVLYPNADNLIDDENNGKIIIDITKKYHGMSLTPGTNIIKFSFMGNGQGNFPDDITPGTLSTIVIGVNDSKFPNYKIDPITINFNLQPTWQWGESDGVADELWFEGLSMDIAKKPSPDFLKNYLGNTKRIVFNEAILDTESIMIQCIHADSTGLFFITKDAFNKPLKPEYSQEPTVEEYLMRATSTFEDYNLKFESAFPGRNFMGDFTLYYVAPGFNADRVSAFNKKVMIPGAAELGLTKSPIDGDVSELKDNDPSNSDYSNILQNRIFVSDEVRKKGLANARETKVSYWTRSTMVKCLPKGYSGEALEIAPESEYLTYKRHYVAVDSNGQAKLVNSQSPEANNIYYAPVFKIKAFQG